MRLFLRIFVWFLAVLFVITLVPYVISPAYDFTEPAPFNGSKLYNPYEGIDSGKWHKANFHAHSNIYWGITDGRASNPEAIHEIYSKMGYDIVGISNYMNLDLPQNEKDKYFPVYEHGFGILKNHYLILGADKVNLMDFVYYPTLNNKQFMVNMLKNQNNLISVVHPWMRNAVSLNDIALLENYDCIEICRYSKTSIEYVDKALSSGKNIKLIANDDSHNVKDHDEFGKALTIINSESKSPDDIRKSIKQGRAVSVNLINAGFNSFDEKYKRIPFLPVLKYFRVVDDTIKLGFDSLASEIKFIGQDGVQKSIVNNSAGASYIFKPEDTYIRAEVVFPGNIVYYLNPVFRYETSPDKIYTAKINYPLTVFYYFLWLVGIIIAVWLFLKMKPFAKGKP